jgi:hypothetical protein
VKPKTPVAMQQLIQQVREAQPFDMPQGDVSGLGDIQRIAKISRKIHKVLDKNGLLSKELFVHR